MIRKRIITSLDNVKMTEDRKDIVLHRILEKADIERDSKKRSLSMKKNNARKYIAAVAAVAVIVVGILVAYPMIGRDYQNVSIKPEQPEGAGANSPSIDESPAGDGIGFGDETIPLTNLTLETKFDEPVSLTIAKQESVQFTEEDKETIINNLDKNGWKDVSGALTSFQSDTEFMLNLSQPETYDYSVHGEKDEVPNFSITEEHVEYSKQFLADSGIVELLQGYGVELSDQPNKAHTTLFYGYYEGYRTETYLRLHFSPDGTLEDAQIYAVHFKEAFPASNVLPLEEAIKNAFYSSECTGLGDDQYAVIGVDVVYKSGLPFYELKLKSKKNDTIMNGYALAVGYNEIETDEELNAALEDLMLNGIW